MGVHGKNSELLAECTNPKHPPILTLRAKPSTDKEPLPSCLLCELQEEYYTHATCTCFHHLHVLNHFLPLFT